MVTFDQSHSSSSATIWARPVIVPCPISERATRITTVSSGRMTTQALISGEPSAARTTVAPQAVVKLIEIYRRLGYEEDVREFCGYLRRFHAGYPEADRTCPAEAGTS